MHTKVIENKFRKVAMRDKIEKFCVGVVVTKGQAILLVRRAKEDFLGGYWELPGGGVDGDESFDIAIRRETKEELGLDIKSYGRVIKSFDYVSESGRKTRQFNIIIYPTHLNITLNPAEHDSFMWVTSSSYQSLPLTPEIRSVLEDCFKA